MEFTIETVITSIGTFQVLFITINQEKRKANEQEKNLFMEMVKFNIDIVRKIEA